MSSGEFASFPVDRIYVDRETRQRKELRNIPELAASIAEIGLLEPPVIERDGRLRAGERRWTAVKSLGWTHMSVQFTDEIDADRLHLIELEENTQRVNLEWREECAAILEYHELRQALSPEWTEAQTADLLHQSQSSINEKISVARSLREGDSPLVTAAPKLSTAVGIVRRTNERKAAAALASVLPSAAPKETPKVPLLNESFLTYTTEAQFNFLHCDFPYGVNADKHHQGQAKSQGGYADGFDIYVALLDRLSLFMESSVAPSAHLMFWFSMDYYAYTMERLGAMGWEVNPFPLVWVKSDNTGILPDPNRGPRRGYETAFLAARGDRKIVRAKTNWFAHPGKDKSIHMSEKPVPMLRHFFEMFVDEYSVMLDPTCGSGNAVKAALALGAPQACGLELDPEFYSRAVEAFYD